MTYGGPFRPALAFVSTAQCAMEIGSAHEVSIKGGTREVGGVTVTRRVIAHGGYCAWL